MNNPGKNQEPGSPLHHCPLSEKLAPPAALANAMSSLTKLTGNIQTFRHITRITVFELDPYHNMLQIRE